MENSMNTGQRVAYIETRGLGAGSYPDAPDLPEYEGPECEGCGCIQGLTPVGGIYLCRECRKAYYLKNCHDRYLDFINRDKRQQQDFFLSWWFENLPDSEKAEIAKKAWVEKFRLKLPALQQEANSIIADYIRETSDDFLEFLDNEEL